MRRIVSGEMALAVDVGPLETDVGDGFGHGLGRFGRADRDDHVGSLGQGPHPLDVDQTGATRALVGGGRASGRDPHGVGVAGGCDGGTHGAGMEESRWLSSVGGESVATVDPANDHWTMLISTVSVATLSTVVSMTARETRVGRAPYCVANTTVNTAVGIAPRTMSVS